MFGNERIREWLGGLGLGSPELDYVVESVQIFSVVLLAFIANLIAKRILLKIVSGLAERTETDWDDIIVRRRVFHRLAHLAPAVVIYLFAPVALEAEPLATWALKAAQIYMLLVGLLVLDALLNALSEIYDQFEVSRRIPITSYLQVVKLLFILAALITAVSLLIDKSPLLLLSGLGAMTAVLLLIFKDTILGLVAGIQIVANDLVRPGDWIEMSKYGADGDVEQITLNVVKVRNFDKTVTTIPTYALISDSFRNWRGMKESGGRRIKRAVSIDVNSIGFCPEEQLERLRRVDRLREFLDKRMQEIAEYNREAGVDASMPVNGRRLTNIGVFREYVKEYLQSHPKIHQGMTLIVRQLAPSGEGLPIEIYAFANDQRWPVYEAIQADIFDHLFAVLPQFGLRAFQQPTGADVTTAAQALRPAAD